MRLVVANCLWNVNLGICPGGATPPGAKYRRCWFSGGEGMHALVQLVVFRLTVTQTTVVEHGVVLLAISALDSMNLC